jgi:hypothetical protein
MKGTITAGCLFISALLMVLVSLSTGFSQETEPEEPEIMLPRVILEIEDLSVETITAGIPEEEIIPGELEVPLPEPEDLQIEEPSIMMTFPQAEGAVLDRGEGQYLNFEGVLGVGSRNNFMSSFSLYQFEREPEGKLVFGHEVFDGLSGNEEGSGYNLRDDNLAGQVGFHAGKFGIQLQGEFNDRERGLQGIGQFYSKISRFGNGAGSFNYPIADRLDLELELGSDLTTQMLTTSGTAAPDPSKTNEYLLMTSLEGRYSFDGGHAGLEPSISYRDGGTDGQYALTRTRIRGFFGLDLGSVTRMEGELSWFWSDASGHLAPFALRLSTYPTDLFSLNASAGFKLQEQNLNDVLSGYPYADVPSVLYDNYGWYFELSSHIHIASSWIMNAGISFMDSSGMLTTSDAVDPVTGLFPIAQTEALQMRTELGLRWNQSMNFSAYMGWIYDILDRPQFYPQHSLNTELSWVGGPGKYGANLTSVFETGVNDSVQAPVVDLSAFYKIADFIRIVGEANDILYPTLGEQRYDWNPYVDVGLQFAFKVYINF